MFRVIKYIILAFKTKKGINHPEELVAETSFGFIEIYFIISFIVLGSISAILGFIGFYYSSNIALVFTVLFVISLAFDIWIYLKVKNFFKKISGQVVDYSKKQIKNNNIVDINSE